MSEPFPPPVLWYLHNLLGNLSCFVDIQDNLGISHHGVECPAFTQAAKNKSNQRNNWGDEQRAHPDLSQPVKLDFCQFWGDSGHGSKFLQFLRNSLHHHPVHLGSFLHHYPCPSSCRVSPGPAVPCFLGVVCYGALPVASCAHRMSSPQTTLRHHSSYHSASCSAPRAAYTWGQW